MQNMLEKSGENVMIKYIRCSGISLVYDRSGGCGNCEHWLIPSLKQLCFTDSMELVPLVEIFTETSHLTG